MMAVVRMMMMAVVRMGLGDILAVAGGSDAVWLPPPLLIIDSVLMSALLGRSRDGSDTNGLPPLSHCEVPPLLLLALVVLSKQSFSPDCHRLGTASPDEWDQWEAE